MVTDDNDAENDLTEPKGGREINVAIGGDSHGNIVVGNQNTIIVRSKPEQERANRNRRAMLEVVQNTWVEGVLEKSLYHETLIDLGLEERPDAVTRPWDVQVQMPDRPKRVLPPGTPITQIFDEAQGELLILGAPGAGKTTMLLELARDVIDRARQDAALPIPVVFNLSSWTDPKQPLATWLVDELINKYHTPKKVAQGWVEQDELLLLLDGLDEVRAENRTACTEAINIFRQAHGLTMPLVVCSRIADYDVLSTRLQLRGAVLLQPLTDEQIDDYFEHAGPELAAVRRAWRQDAELQELARQPLMLSIMTLAYRGVTQENLAGEQVGSLEDRRKHLFNAYIEQMFARVGRTKDERYTPEQVAHYLAWLAHKLVEQGQSVFLLENLRSSWLSGTQQRLHQTVVGVTVGLVGGLMVGLVGGLMVGLGFGLGTGLVATGLILGLTDGLGGAGIETKAAPNQRIQWSLKSRLGIVLGVGLLGLGYVLGGYGLIIGLLGGLLGGRMSEVPTERLKWSWRKALVGLVVGGMGFGLVVGLLGGLGYGLAVGLLFGLLGGLIFGFLSGLEAVGMETKTVPNQGIQHSLKNGLGIGLGVWLGVWLLGGLGWFWLKYYGLGWDDLIASLGIWLILGLAAGLAVGLAAGGSAMINHYLRRFLLYRSGYIPQNYEHFLDYAVERLFLRRVGGSYVFAHRLLMEHFAAMWGKI